MQRGSTGSGGGEDGRPWPSGRGCYWSRDETSCRIQAPLGSRIPPPPEEMASAAENKWGVELEIPTFLRCVTGVLQVLSTHHVVKWCGVEHELKDDLGHFPQLLKQLLDLEGYSSDQTNHTQLCQHGRPNSDRIQRGLSEGLCLVHQRHQEALQELQQVAGQLEDPKQTNLQGRGAVVRTSMNLVSLQQ